MKMKEIIIPAALMFLTVISCIIYVASRAAKVDYVDVQCPACGSCEVLDFGTKDGRQKAHCYDCKQEFYISEVQLHAQLLCK
jgi:predicted RNA-binding Zn-ribbon protein involved in translation (DUF1610 family)